MVPKANSCIQQQPVILDAIFGVVNQKHVEYPHYGNKAPLVTVLSLKIYAKILDKILKSETLFQCLSRQNQK